MYSFYEGYSIVFSINGGKVLQYEKNANDYNIEIGDSLDLRYFYPNLLVVTDIVISMVSETVFVTLSDEQ